MRLLVNNHKEVGTYFVNSYDNNDDMSTHVKMN